MKTAFLPPRVGNWVRGDTFFNREHELDTLERLLQEGAHVSLIAQRRIGKTSLLREAARRLEGRITCLYVDLEACRSAEDAIVAIALAASSHQRLWSRIRGAFENVLAGVESVGVDALSIQLRTGIAGDWRAKGRRLCADLAAADPPVALLIDELPVLLVSLLRDEQRRPKTGGIEQADALLSWLRSICIEFAGKLRVVVTGSIGLEPVARQAGLSGTLNVYTPFPLGPWSPAIALRCIEALSGHADLRFEPEAAEEMVDLLGCCIPYHVQLFHQLLVWDARQRKSLRVGLEDVRRVYTTRMLSSHGHVELAHLEERLRLVVEHAHQPLTLDLLTEAAIMGHIGASEALVLARDHLPTGADPKSILRDLFGILEHDGYLRRDPDERHRFESKLLRDWWKARFGAFYTRAMDRK